MSRFLAAAPLLALPVAAYNLLAELMAGGLASAGAAQRLAAPLFSLRTASGGAWPVSAADLLLAGALVVLFAELTKSTRDRTAAIVNHGLSVVLFVVCLAEMLMAPACATSTFFLITLMVLLDVMAGFILILGAHRGEARSRR